MASGHQQASPQTAQHDKDTTGLILGSDGRPRCFWAGDHADYALYHDEEWGRPVSDDTRLFEKMCLEGFQSGLSWLTILRKREAFRTAFCGFDIDKIARFTERDVERLLQDAAIVRHRGKIEATINNARCMADLLNEFGSFAAFVWRYEPPKDSRPQQMTYAALKDISQTSLSKAFAKDLKSRGFRFFGPTTAYAFMQAMGLVNDHIEGCCVREACEVKNRQFVRPI